MADDVSSTPGSELLIEAWLFCWLLQASQYVILPYHLGARRRPDYRLQDQSSDEGVRLEDPTELVSLARQLKLRRKTLTTTLQTMTELLTTTTPSTSPAAAPGTTSATPASTELPTTASGSRWYSGILNQVSRITTGPPRSEVRPNLYDEPSYTKAPVSTTMAPSTTTPPLSTRTYYSTTPQQTTETSSSTTPQQTTETSSSTTPQQTTQTSYSTTPQQTTEASYSTTPPYTTRPGRRKPRREPPSTRWSGLSDTPRPGDNQECRIEDGEYSAVLRKSLVNARGCFRATLQLQCGPMGTRTVSLKIMRRETFWKTAFRNMYVRQIKCPAFFDALGILASNTRCDNLSFWDPKGRDVSLIKKGLSEELPQLLWKKDGSTEKSEREE
ncbi:hypothetical protein FOZ62_025898, partial [Perkinsus olseni]